MNFFSRLAIAASVLCLALILPIAVFAGDDWKPVNPTDLALKTPLVESDADAEGLFWNVRVDDSQPNELSLDHYLRVKIFSERGKESQSKIDIPYYSSTKIREIAARVIKPDGSIVELKKDDVFERTIVKANGVKVKAKSFALPGVEPGAIVEYRWREVYPGGHIDHMRLQFQRDIPVRVVNYYLKPYMGLRYQTFHMNEMEFVKDKNGFYRFTLNNVAAFREEPRMPPEDEVRAWVFLYYAEDLKRDPEKYWKDHGRLLFEKTKDAMKVNDAVKTAAAGIIGDATTDQDKLQRIYDFCRTKIKNTSDDASGLTTEEKSKLKENKSPADTLKNARGTGGDIDMLFGALAKAAGFDARYAVSGNRDDLFFHREFAEASFLASSFIAVRVGDGWQFFSPAEMYTSFGMLGWPEQSQDALITDAKEPMWVKTGLAAPDKSVEKRIGKFRLLEDGTLEGDVRVEFTGHLDFDQKEDNDDDSPTQREETLRDRVRARMSTAELSDIHIENVTDPLKPFMYAYHVRVAGYAQRTGKRLFLQPAYFEHGQAELFPSSARKEPIYFHFPWTEDDTVEISLPTGYSLDSPDAPADITPALTQNISAQNIQIAVTGDGHTLILKRKFYFGGNDGILFPPTSYAPLRVLFEMVHKNDNHTITLKQNAAQAAN
jgi:hypothetical protein